MFEEKKKKSLGARIYGNTPSKSNCYRIVTIKKKNSDDSYSSLAKTAKLKKYEEEFYIQLPAHLRGAKIDGYFTFEIHVYYPSERADLDNSLKVVLDCLQKSETIVNDNKCVEILAKKFKDKKEPRIEFKIQPL